MHVWEQLLLEMSQRMQRVNVRSSTVSLFDVIAAVLVALSLAIAGVVVVLSFDLLAISPGAVSGLTLSPVVSILALVVVYGVYRATIDTSRSGE
ncbi:MAG: hypothetical protein ACQETB_04940 [Halobacteriota archaeon]